MGGLGAAFGISWQRFCFNLAPLCLHRARFLEKVTRNLRDWVHVLSRLSFWIDSWFVDNPLDYKVWISGWAFKRKAPGFELSFLLLLFLMREREKRKRKKKRGKEREEEKEREEKGRKRGGERKKRRKKKRKEEEKKRRDYSKPDPASSGAAGALHAVAR